MRRRNFPKGYAEMLEKQHNQLVGGLQEMYHRLQKADLWEGEPLDEFSGRPLTHDILAALNFLDPQADGSDAEFIEQPRLGPVADDHDDHDDDHDDDHEDDAKSPVDSTQEIPEPLTHDESAFLDFDLDAPAPAQTTTTTSTSKSSSNALSPTTPSPNHHLAQPKFQNPSTIPTPPRHILPTLSPPSPILPDLLWNDQDTLYTFSPTQLEDPSSSTSSSFDSSAYWFQPFSPPTMTAMPPLATQFQSPARGSGAALYIDNTSTLLQKRAARARGGHSHSLSDEWLGSGVGFDSSDFMGDFHRMSPLERMDGLGGFEGGRRAGSLT